MPKVGYPKQSGRSGNDLEKVRQIRNELERRGHNPLLFFLKSLEADDPEKG